MLKQLKISLLMLSILSVITGLLYPVLITILAQTFFHWKANGSLIQQQDKIVGSLLIGQEFHSAKYFWGRPSATKGASYNTMASGGSNLAPSNPELMKLIEKRVTILRQANPDANMSIPTTLVTASASGLDPDINIHAAYYQAPRVARARKANLDVIKQLISQQSKGGLLFSEQAYVNVLQLNLMLDRMAAEGTLK